MKIERGATTRRNFLGAAALTTLGGVAMADSAPIVQTVPGVLRGTMEPNGALVWRGVPFAQPPVGALRGKAPQKLLGWAGVRDATRFGNKPVQQNFPPAPSEKVTGSEDCLYLNIWTPPTAAVEPRPVLVWIYGGAFVQGSGSEPVYNGADYAVRGDLVYVTFNYRLGGFGYLLNGRDPASANLALLDQIAALEWVRDNIAAFGGDPGKVTVMGESAGGMSIGCLLGAPGARGLFHRAILQSGGARPIYAHGEPRQIQQLALAKAGLKTDDAARLMDLSALVLNNIFTAIALESGSALLGGEAFHPAVDGIVLPAHPLENLSSIPALIGHCENEGAVFGAMKQSALAVGLPAKVKSLAGAGRWTAIEAAYQRSARPGRDWSIDLFSDIFTSVPSLRLGNGLAKAGAKVWMYRFDYAKASPFGASHGSDVTFTFGKPDGGMMPTVWNADAYRLSVQMRDSFIAFARHGSPATAVLPAWPQHDPHGLAYMRFDSTCSVDHDFVGAARRAAWAEVPITAL